jgi:hypothetical protein
MVEVWAVTTFPSTLGQVMQEVQVVEVAALLITLERVALVIHLQQLHHKEVLAVQAHN